jgi:predicted aspartyl protease
MIPAIWLGSHRIDGVEVAFIEDSKLGGSGLLGMSVLGRFTMTIDDDENQLTLGRKQ